MTKQLLVSSPLQVALMKQLLLNEIQNGFWVGMRPVDHGKAWDGVDIVVASGDEVGPVGFKPMKNYDFLNPEFTKQFEAQLVQVAQTVKPSMTFKALKKELIELARIIGGRMTDKTKEPARAYRGNNRADFDVIRVVDRQKVVTAAGIKVAAPEVQVKRTVVKQTVVKKAAADEDGVTTMVTSSGATVRKVAVKTVTTTEA